MVSNLYLSSCPVVVCNHSETVQCGTRFTRYMFACTPVVHKTERRVKKGKRKDILAQGKHTFHCRSKCEKKIHKARMKGLTSGCRARSACMPSLYVIHSYVLGSSKGMQVWLRTPLEGLEHYESKAMSAESELEGKGRPLHRRHPRQFRSLDTDLGNKQTIARK
ncbi:hypothetical protein BKA82DRAFT_2469410 [Pisolithus tinctorius]|nr:hypothetical protein BKA82DRAFT_2469410 [Pisolithus tinctorius]